MFFVSETNPAVLIAGTTPIIGILIVLLNWSSKMVLMVLQPITRTSGLILFTACLSIFKTLSVKKFMDLFP